MRPAARRFVARLILAAGGLGCAYVLLLSLTAPAPETPSAPQEYGVALLPKEERLLPDTAMVPRAEPLLEAPEPLPDLSLPDLVDIEPYTIQPPLPEPRREPEPEAPGVHTPVVPRIEVPPEIEPRRVEKKVVDGDLVWAMPPPRRIGNAKRVAEWAAPDEELWVIARSDGPSAPTAETPGGGEVVATVPSEAREVPVPLKDTHAFAGISGYIATVTVKQRFVNPYDAPIEALYRFPLPHNAAIHDFIITIGKRRIRGVVRERLEAERIYREARRQGLRSVLLAQDGPCMFSHRVANVAPQDAIDVEFKYFHTLAHRDGWYEFVFPMVQRPSATERDDEGTPVVEVPARRSGRNIEVRVAIDAGLPIEEIASPSHKVITRHPYRSRGEWARVSLATARYVANRDFVLRYRVAGDALRSAMLFHRSKLGGFFTLMVQPPADLEAPPRQPIELVFALDCSGSMKGAPLTKARVAIRRALKQLSPRDTFQILRFADRVEPLGPQPVTATVANAQRAVAWLEEVEARGGTDLYEGVRTALALPEPRERLRFLVLLTDGYVRRDGEVLTTVARKAGETRVFSIGLGKAPYRYLLERMAQLGRGAVAHVGPGDDPAAVMDRFVARATRPAMTHLSIDWGTLRAADVYPERVPDVFCGRPVVLVGRFRSARATTVRIRGLVAGKPREIRLEVDPGDGGPAHTAIPPLWAKAHIAAVARELAEGGTPAHAQQIIRLARHFNLVTPLTDIIVIDTIRRTKGHRSPTIVTPDLVPQSLNLSPTLYRP